MNVIWFQIFFDSGFCLSKELEAEQIVTVEKRETEENFVPIRFQDRRMSER